MSKKLRRRQAKNRAKKELLDKLNKEAQLRRDYRLNN
jgi:hypothetical protein